MEKVAGYIALTLGAVSFAMGLYVGFRTQAEARCQTNINQEFLATLKQRAAIGKENTDNINTLIKDVFSTKDPKVAMHYYQDYLTELDTINGELGKATYPNFTSC